MRMLCALSVSQNVLKVCNMSVYYSVFLKHVMLFRGTQ